MKKITFSTAAVVMLAMSVNANASAEAELAELKKQMAAMLKKIERLEAKQAKQAKTVKEVQKKQETVVAEAPHKGTLVKSKAPTLEFSGKHYLGFVSDFEKDTNKFETRRNYFQVKGYFDENSKDYFRITLDTFHDSLNVQGDGISVTSADEGSWAVRLKYAYLYLDNIFPFTGVEIGQAHRPWIDYEEHHGWWYRSISHVLVENGNAAGFTNSADLGVNFKTSTENFSSELGVFNGEGYHGSTTDDNTKVSGEWRLTGHILGTGKKKVHKSDTYADVSFFGQHNADYKESVDDFVWYGIHAVYNQPEFLLAVQYVKAVDGGDSREGEGWSVNGEYRFIQDWNLLGRYDNFKLDDQTEDNAERKRIIAGIAYQYNKNVEFIANYLNENKDGDTKTNALMLTTEVNW